MKPQQQSKSTQVTKGENTMFKTVITIGLNDKDKEIQIIPTEAAEKIIAEILIENHGIFAFTMFNCKGVYKMSSTGNIIQENSIRVEIIEETEREYTEIINEIKTALNQESVMIEITENATVKFI